MSPQANDTGGGKKHGGERYVSSINEKLIGSRRTFRAPD